MADLPESAAKGVGSNLSRGDGQVYGTGAKGLASLRSLAGRILRRHSILLLDDLVSQVAASGITVEAGDDAKELRLVLGCDGTGPWAWPPLRNHTPLTRTARRLALCGRMLTAPDLAASVLRCSAPYPRNGRDLPADAVRAWASTQPGWTLTADDVVRPVQPLNLPGHPTRTDLLVLDVLARQDFPLSWRQFMDRLAERGAPPSLSAYILRFSPLVARSPDGYRLVGST
jgi:hypothetical protein